MAALVSKVKAPFQSLIQFVTEAWFELKRVVWPTREEAQSFTAVVVIAVAIVAVWVGSLDWIFATLVSLLNVYGS
ncbi:MAG: preprotein translocase subunit SecE [Armatimonadetes bacterium]|nr:preprotein translocase subunit SecE [Armatimonadota bacterium]